MSSAGVNGSSVGPDELVSELATIVSDYRRADGLAIGPEDIARWVDQFDRPHRLHVLRETHAIMKARYFSQEDTRRYADKMMRGYAKLLANGDVVRFLSDTAFLDLQPTGKSQPALLEIVGEVIQAHGFSVEACGGAEPKRYLYLDDILCTGNTLYQDMRAWWLERDANGQSRQERLPAGVTVYYHFLVLHRKNWFKTRARLGHDEELRGRAKPPTARAGIIVQNDREPGSHLDFAFPRRTGISEAAEEYVRQIGAKPEDAFREDGTPKEESLFTSPEGRDAFEHAVVGVGLNIIDSVQTHNPNFHPLGYQIPSHKSLGFGALAFTWRNVPNNTPLAFWHDASIWTPLFKKRQASAEDFGFVVET